VYTSFRAAGVAGDTDKDMVSFRSSRIEFWAIEDISEAPYVVGVESVPPDTPEQEADSFNVAIELNLGDREDSFLFVPDSYALFITQSLPEFDYTKKYNLIRIDVRDGNISFKDDGTQIVPVNSEGEEADIKGNSILLVDEEILQSPLYLATWSGQEREWDADIEHEYQELIEDQIIAYADAGTITEDVKTFLLELLVESYKFGGFDLSGGLIIPFTPTDFSEYESINNVIIDVQWDMENAWSESGGKYIVEDRVKGLPYDFKVKLIVE
jgi:hypothetical protein